VTQTIPRTLTAVPKELSMAPWLRRSLCCVLQPKSKSSSTFACMLVASLSKLGAAPATGRPAIPSSGKMACFFLAAEKEGGVRLLSTPPTAMDAEGERARACPGRGIGGGGKGDV